MSLKNYETIITNTVTGPSLGHRYVITAINEQKKVKRNRIIFVTRDADKKKKNSTITLLVNMNLIAFGWAKIFVTLNRSDKFLVDSTWSPFLTHNVQWTQSQATGEMENELTLWLYWRCGRGTYTDIDRTFRKKVQLRSLRFTNIMLLYFYGFLQRQKTTITTWLKQGDSQDFQIDLVPLSIRNIHLFRK